MIARKVSHCSKTEGGADAFGAFTSVIRTLARKGAVSRWWMVCAVCSAVRLSTPAPPEPLPHLYASANQLPSVQNLLSSNHSRNPLRWWGLGVARPRSHLYRVCLKTPR